MQQYGKVARTIASAPALTVHMTSEMTLQERAPLHLGVLDILLAFLHGRRYAHRISS
jgi:hypothetical protein